MKWKNTEIPAATIVSFAVLAIVIIAINIAAFAGVVWLSVWLLRCLGVIA